MADEEKGIWVNGRKRTWQEGMKVVDLATQYGYLYIVVVNGDTVPIQKHKTYDIPNGAVIRLIHLIEGG